ncbi:MAG TPA: type II toxin-antitoxin system VapC family toxin [Solirubrobacteraceae bacterium]|nr:type II toxin-antitoxin system VapC family toxin [Solirubrobacteraceae bacterium]
MSEAPEVVLDASALIALLWEEPGAETVEPLLSRSIVSAVNWAEVLQRYRAHAIETDGKRESVEALGVRFGDFCPEDSDVVAELWLSTRAAGLSLADRACLALARRLNLAAYTADRDWRKVDVGVEIVLIR